MLFHYLLPGRLLHPGALVGTKSEFNKTKKLKIILCAPSNAGLRSQDHGSHAVSSMSIFLFEAVDEMVRRMDAGIAVSTVNGKIEYIHPRILRLGKLAKVFIAILLPPDFLHCLQIHPSCHKHALDFRVDKELVTLRQARETAHRKSEQLHV